MRNLVKCLFILLISSITVYSQDTTSLRTRPKVGLVLSGGNLEWTGTEIVANSLGGLLTANDIEKLDLSSTELAVLSACGTGEGEVTSEGVYGLQRAFKRAGVKHVIMTLWHVNDSMAKEFMTEFYRNLTGNGGNVESALLETKKAFQNKDPYYWAGYVLLD
jgi:CHAT domain-containing protein